MNRRGDRNTDKIWFQITKRIPEPTSSEGPQLSVTGTNVSVPPTRLRSNAVLYFPKALFPRNLFQSLDCKGKLEDKASQRKCDIAEPSANPRYQCSVQCIVTTLARQKHLIFHRCAFGGLASFFRYPSRNVKNGLLREARGALPSMLHARNSSFRAYWKFTEPM